MVKALCFHCGRRGFDPWLGKIPHAIPPKIERIKKKNTSPLRVTIKDQWEKARG